MREKVAILAVLVSVSLLSGLLLALSNHFSHDLIEKNRQKKIKDAIVSVLYSGHEKGLQGDTFDKSIKAISTDMGLIHVIEGLGKAAFIVSGKGFWGPIRLAVAVDMKTLLISGLEVISQEETPGLGARIEDAAFRDSFKGKSMEKAIGVKSRSEKLLYNDVEAVTGATVTSKAIEKILNESAASYIDAIREMHNER